MKYSVVYVAKSRPGKRDPAEKRVGHTTYLNTHTHGRLSFAAAFRGLRQTGQERLSYRTVCTLPMFFLFLTPPKKRTQFKGTVARDFWPLVFFMNRPHMGP
jgi:hypothetical protein